MLIVLMLQEVVAMAKQHSSAAAQLPCSTADLLGAMPFLGMLAEHSVNGMHMLLEPHICVYQQPAICSNRIAQDLGRQLL